MTLTEQRAFNRAYPFISHVAEYYRTAEHTPNDPSYSVFVRETIEQFESLQASGYRFARTAGNPYKTSAEMFEDIRAKRLLVSSAGQSFEVNHPLAGPYVFPLHWQYQTWKLNEVFRAVHDINGHGPSCAMFETFAGELEALKNHARMYSPAAHGALFGETFGQLCHYYAGLGFVEIQRAVTLPDRWIKFAAGLRLESF